MPALPTTSDFNGPGVTEAAFKSALSDMRGFLATLLGEDGTVATALAALGALGAGYLDKSAAYTVTTADRGRLIGATGTWSLGLPAAATAGAGFAFSLRNTGSGIITVDPSGSETINGASTLDFGPQSGGLVVSDGSAWLVPSLSPQTSAEDGTTGRAVLVGGFGLGDASSAPLIADFDAALPTGLYRYLGGAGNGKPDASETNGSVLVQNTSGGRGYIAIRAATTGDPRAWIGKRRTASDTDPVWNEMVLVGTGGVVSLEAGRLTLNSNALGGDTVAIADDAVATLTPPRTGGFALITCAGGGGTPRSHFSVLVWYDTGTDLEIDKAPNWGAVGTSVDVTTSDLTGTSGTDGKFTVAARTGALKIENRSGAARSLQITYL